MIPPPAMNLGAWQDWNNIISIRSVAEQVGILATAYEPYLLRLAFMNSEFEDLLPSFVRRPNSVSAPTQHSMVPQSNPQAFQQQQPFQQPMSYPQPQQQMGYAQQQYNPQPQYTPQQGYAQPQAPFAMPMGPSEEDGVDNEGNIQLTPGAVAQTLPPGGVVNPQQIEESKRKLQNLMQNRQGR